MVGRRDEEIGKIIDGYKYQSIRALAWPIVEMIDKVLPCLPKNTVVVPVPTISRHVRARGLDHTWLMAKGLARMRGWGCVRMVRRVTNAVQVGANAKQRYQQAKGAYELVGKVDARWNYLVIDDICTTGASLEVVCEVLKKGGAKDISVVVLAKSGN
jgi:ComF family protein